MAAPLSIWALTLPAEDAEGDRIKKEGLAWDGPDLDISVVDSDTLMRDRREMLIRHNGQTYRLRMTMSDKLILTK